MRRVFLGRTSLACFALALALFAWSARERAQDRANDARPAALIERLLGPIASLAANLEWVRVDDALRLGRPDLAYARAELALEIAPGDAEGWIFLAHHFAYERASILREPDRAARTRWVDAALDLLARGEKSAREPGRLAFKRGVIFATLALMDDADRPWPGTRREAWLEAARAFDRAAEAQEPIAREAAKAARDAAGSQ
jgi:hypothetical protein